MRPKRVTLEQFQYVAFAFVRESMIWDEPVPAFETRFADRLESCLASPFMRFDGRDLYRGLIGKAAIMFYLLIKSHPFQNGNKRIAIMGTLYFLHSNGYWLGIGNNELYEFSRAVAASDRREKEAIVLMIAGMFKHYLVRLKKPAASR